MRQFEANENVVITGDLNLADRLNRKQLRPCWKLVLKRDQSTQVVGRSTFKKSILDSFVTKLPIVDRCDVDDSDKRCDHRTVKLQINLAAA